MHIMYVVRDVLISHIKLDFSLLICFLCCPLLSVIIQQQQRHQPPLKFHTNSTFKSLISGIDNVCVCVYVLKFPRWFNCHFWLHCQIDQMSHGIEIIQFQYTKNPFLLIVLINCSFQMYFTVIIVKNRVNVFAALCANLTSSKFLVQQQNLSKLITQKKKSILLWFFSYICTHIATVNRLHITHNNTIRLTKAI